jgi:general secretion pathway protein G
VFKQCARAMLVPFLAMIGVGLLTTFAPPPIRQKEKDKVKTAAIQIETLGTALDTFRLDLGRYPTTQEGLAALNQRPVGLDRWDGPYLKRKEIPKDPWDRPYYYRSPGEGGRPYDLYTYGADGAPGGDGDNRDVGVRAERDA